MDTGSGRGGRGGLGGDRWGGDKRPFGTSGVAEVMLDRCRGLGIVGKRKDGGEKKLWKPGNGKDRPGEQLFEGGHWTDASVCRRGGGKG